MLKFLQGFLRWFKSIKKEEKSPEKSGKKGPSIINGPSVFRRKDKVVIQVGLDFGTSSTKIAYSQLGGRGKKVQPVFFNHNLSHYPNYCLPSVSAFNEAGKIILGAHAARFLADKPWDTGFRRLKMVVAGKYDEGFKDQVTMNLFRNYLSDALGKSYQFDPEHLTAILLAYAMRTARLEIQKTLEGCELDLIFNICIPIDHFENNHIRNVFEKILATAEVIESEWFYGFENNNLLEFSKNKFSISKYLPDDPKTRVFAVPEAVAETASYVVSLQVKEGLHAIIDFGAGTTDLSIFNLHDAHEADSTTYWYSARNLPRGFQRVEKIIAGFLKSNGKNFSDMDVEKELRNIEKSPITLQGDIKKELFSLWESSHFVWQEAYSHLKKQSEWGKQKVQIFTCGGGSKIPFIEEIFCQSWMKDWGPYPINKLPVPDDYDTVNDKAPFERMSVAYGLTQPLPEIGKYVLPGDCPIQTPPPLPIKPIHWWNRPTPNQDWLGRD